MIKGFYINKERNTGALIEEGEIIRVNDDFSHSDCSATWEEELFDFDENDFDFSDSYGENWAEEKDELDFWEECEEIEPDDLILELLNFND